MPGIADSRLAGFYNKTVEDRFATLAETAGLEKNILDCFRSSQGLTLDQADHMIENVIGVFGLPLGIATNFRVNDHDVLVPMVIEEPSVVAGASFMAKLARAGGGFKASTTNPEMIGQIQVLDVPDLKQAERQLMEAKDEILTIANEVDPVLINLGGGARDLEIRQIEESPVGPMLVLHVIYDTRDAMGANAVNSAVERLKETVESLSGGRVHLRILSNLTDRRLAKASCTIPTDELAFDSFHGETVRDGIVEAWAFAAADPYRAATHNKGIMNGVDAVVIATGNDWRAIEAGAHAYAAKSGRYTPLSTWQVDPEGNLQGSLEMPMAVGTVGGATRVHPVAKACLELMHAESASQLAEIIVSVGLAQNLAALRALSSEGIQRGHMSLHARQVAMTAGAEGSMITIVAERMVQEGKIGIDQAKTLLEELQGS